MFFFAEKKCADPRIPVNARVKFNSSGLTAGTTATYECNEGYESVGNTITSCSPIGKWIGELPFCGKIIYFYLSNTFNADIQRHAVCI